MAVGEGHQGALLRFLWGTVPVPTYLYDPSHAAQVVVTICMLLQWLRLRCILLDWFQHSFNFDRFSVVSSCFFSSTDVAVHLTFWPSDVGRVAHRLMLIQEPIFACLGNMLLGGRFGELGDSKCCSGFWQLKLVLWPQMSSAVRLKH